MMTQSQDSTFIRFHGHVSDRFPATLPAWVFGKCLLIFLGAALAFVLSACCGNQPIIRDIQRLPQDASFYLPKDWADRPALDPAAQQALNEHYNQVFFAPWHRDQPAYGKEEMLQRLEKFRGNLGYGENRQPHTRQWLEQLEQDMVLQRYPNAGFAAITSAGTDLRELPTLKPHFNAFDVPGEGYPFDNFQYSAIPANTPVFVSHLTANRSWALVESHYGLGWLRSGDVASVQDDFMRSWEVGRYVTLTKDDWPLYDDRGRFLFRVPVGLMLPIADETTDGYRVLVGVADENRSARLREISLPREAVARKPLTLTPANIARIANQFMNQPYGWGGLYGNRDCSATLKDLFAPFGLWLPRNSFHQVHSAGIFLPLYQLSPAAKTQTILAEGVPFLTLLWAKGHIALYLGNYCGQPVVFHNLWGIRTMDWRGQAGRKVIGHAAITTLHPGAELCNVDRVHGDLLTRIEGMAILFKLNGDAETRPRVSPQGSTAQIESALPMPHLLGVRP
jgi:hypothetical protein